jgi:hypothetical protein
VISFMTATDEGIKEPEEVSLENPPFLDSLSIANFRAFRRLQIDRLGHVNLIVGKNNIGKTCLLEALWLYARIAAPEVISQILGTRNELTTRAVEESQLSTVRHLLHGRSILDKSGQEQLIISSGGDELTARVFSLDRGLIEQIEQAPLHLDVDVIPNLANQLVTGPFDRNGLMELRKKMGALFHLIGEESLILVIKASRGVRIINDSLKQILASNLQEWPTFFIATSGLNNAQIVKLWNQVYLTELQDEVEAALRIIEPNLRNVGLVSNLEGAQVPQARMSTGQDRILLSSLGEGMNRLFGLALALVNTKGGFLLIDEIGNGIHYSIQPQLWNFIFTLAHRLNVQVFATTHTWDAVEAFQQAAQDHQKMEGMLVSLRGKQGSPGEVVGTLFNETDLAYITREQIEVR